MNKNTIIGIAYFIAISAFIVTVWLNIDGCNRSAKEKANILALSDSVTHYRNVNNELVSKVEVLTFDNTNIILEIKSKDKSIAALQNAIVKYEKENIHLTNVITFQAKTIMHMEDSVRNLIIAFDSTLIHTDSGDIVIVYPVYKKEYNLLVDSTKYPNLAFTSWITQSITLGEKTFNSDLTINNAYELAIGSESQGWFKSPKYYGYITPLNPYEQINNERVYSKTKPKTSIVWKALPVVTFIIGLLL